MDPDRLWKLATGACGEARIWFSGFGEVVSVTAKRNGDYPWLEIVLRKLTRDLKDLPKRFNGIPFHVTVSS